MHKEKTLAPERTVIAAKEGQHQRFIRFQDLHSKKYDRPQDKGINGTANGRDNARNNLSLIHI